LLIILPVNSDRYIVVLVGFIIYQGKHFILQYFVKEPITANRKVVFLFLLLEKIPSDVFKDLTRLICLTRAQASSRFLWL